MKRYLGTFLAISIAVGLFLYTYYLERPHSLTKQVTLYSIPLPSIDRVAITEKSDLLSLKKNDKGDWEIVGNTSTFANPSKVRELLENLAEMKVTEVEGADLGHGSLYGLEPPARTVKIHTQTGIEKVIFLGNKTPLDGNLYMRLPETQKLYLIPESKTVDVSTDFQKFKSPETQTLPESQPQSRPETPPETQPQTRPETQETKPISP